MSVVESNWIPRKYQNKSYLLESTLCFSKASVYTNHQNVYHFSQRCNVNICQLLKSEKGLSKVLQILCNVMLLGYSSVWINVPMSPQILVKAYLYLSKRVGNLLNDIANIGCTVKLSHMMGKCYRICWLRVVIKLFQWANIAISRYSRNTIRLPPVMRQGTRVTIERWMW